MDYEVNSKIAQLAAKDAFYQDLLKQCEYLGAEYRRIRDSLPEEDRDKLEYYIAICEELEYQHSRMAYAIGTQDGSRTGTVVLKAD